MRLRLAVLLFITASCGKQLNADFCDAHPADERCPGVAGADAQTDGAAADVATAQCPADYDQTITGSTSKYRIVDGAELWHTAEADCADDGATTHLIVLSNEAERQGISSLIDRERHVGHSDEVVDMTWAPVTDEPGVYPAITTGETPPWSPDEPSGTGNCAIIAPGLEMRDRDCSNDVQAYLCECDAYAEDPTNF